MKKIVIENINLMSEEEEQTLKFKLKQMCIEFKEVNEY